MIAASVRKAAISGRICTEPAIMGLSAHPGSGSCWAGAWTVSWTLPFAGAGSPAAGSESTTVPAFAGWPSASTATAFNPAACSLAAAWATERPTTAGTARDVPLDTTKPTRDPDTTCAPAPGVLLIT